MAIQLKKKYSIPIIACLFLYVGSSFREDFFEVAKQIEIFTTLFKELNKNYVDDTNPADLTDKAIQGMLASLDPYTVFYNEQDVVKFKINNTGEYTSIGASMTRKENRLIIREPYKNFPADKAGLKAGDEIIQIGDVVLTDFKTDVSQLFKGVKNTKIDLKYIRQGKVKTTQIVLDEVEIKSVPFFSKIDDKTGYIVLASFNRKAAIETQEALEKLKEQGVERIILDVRNNPGGLLNEAVAVCNLFVPKNEIIVTTKSKIEKHNSTYRTTKDPVDSAIPLVILINKKSASAAEIVSGALQDLDRAVIIGSRSFGKGLVQKPIDLTYGTQLKVTISRYYTPSGRCIQALDYSRKDKDEMNTEKKHFAFKTKQGRTVYDGGGIEPDIALDETKLSPIGEALEKNDIIFDFATAYYYKNPDLTTPFSTLSANDYEYFKSFLKTVKFSFITETQLALKNMLTAAQKEKIDEKITSEYNQLLLAIQKSEATLLDKHQKEIKNLILNELIKRYQYQEGLYQYYIKNNTEIKRTIQLFNTMSKYKSILKKT